MRLGQRLVFGLACALLVSASADAQLVTSGLRGYWKLDEASGTTVTDSSGQGANGTYISSPVLAKSGIIVRSVGFGGNTTTRASLPFTVLNGLTSVSFSFWLRTTDTGYHAIISANSNSRDNEYFVYIENGQLNVRYRDVSNAFFWNLNSPFDGDWHHYVVVTNNATGQTTVYQDAVSLGTNNVAPGSAITVSSGGLFLAQDQDCVGGCFNAVQRLIGDLDEVYIFNRAITPTEIGLLNSFIGHWKLNQASGFTATDSSPVANNGTYTSGPVLNQTGPYPGTGIVAAQFDGVNDYVSVLNESNYDVTGALTVAAWIKVNQLDLSNQTVIAKGDGSSWQLRRSGSTNVLQFDCFGLSATTITGITDVNDGNWHHVVGVYNGSTLSLYVDGKLDNSVAATGSITTNSQNVRIASNAQTSGRNWEGPLYDVRLYARALSTTEIAELYGLVGHWQLSETSGTTAADSSLMAKNATYTNGVTLNQSGPYSGNIAAQFDGINDYVNLPSYNTDFSNGFAIAVWAEPTSSASWARFADLGRGTDLDNVFLTRQATTSTLEAAIHDGTLGNKALLTKTNAIINNTWHHYLVSSSVAGQMKLYVDAVEVASGTVGRPSNVTRTSNYIARSNWAGDAYLRGRMFDVRLYNRPLSSAEVLEVFGSANTWAGVRILKWVEVQ